MINDSDIPKNVRLVKIEAGAGIPSIIIYHHLPVQGLNLKKPLFFHQPTNGNLGHRRLFSLATKKPRHSGFHHTFVVAQLFREATEAAAGGQSASSWTYRLGEFIVGYVWEKSGKNIAKYFLDLSIN